MAKSFGQQHSTGHSHGPYGHAGLHRIGGHGSTVGSEHSNPHSQNSMLGHTLNHSNGGSVPMGCG